jgi:hypothetical protein
MARLLNDEGKQKAYAPNVDPAHTPKESTHNPSWPNRLVVIIIIIIIIIIQGPESRGVRFNKTKTNLVSVFSNVRGPPALKSSPALRAVR